MPRPINLIVDHGDIQDLNTALAAGAAYLHNVVMELSEEYNDPGHEAPVKLRRAARAATKYAERLKSAAGYVYKD